MLAKPQFHQGHKNSTGIEVWIVKGISLTLPFGTEFAGYFFYEGAKFIEFLFCSVAVKKIEVGVVIDLPFFRPKVSL